MLGAPAAHCPPPATVDGCAEIIFLLQCPGALNVFPRARAKEQLLRLGLIREDERAGVSKVLHAAALTYVAALVGSVLQLFYYFSAANDDRS